MYYWDRDARVMGGSGGTMLYNVAHCDNGDVVGGMEGNQYGH